MTELESRREGVAKALGISPDNLIWFRAPGRVNLMGEHTDYNEGFVLPAAIGRDCLIGVKPGESRVRIVSMNADGAVDIAADGSEEPREVRPAWGRYVAGVVGVLAELGRSPIGLDAAVHSSVPLGAGLSSSAALEVACTIALMHVAGMSLSAEEIAKACQSAERIATGVPCGVMDQLISLKGSKGAALLIDCRSLETDLVPLPPDLSIIAVDSGVRRELADSAYAVRRAACEKAAARLGLRSLREATIKQVEDDPIARHVVSENTRVLKTVDALRDGDHEELGRLFAEGHASLRDDFKVSTPELDLLVDLMVKSGAVAARLTGAGFGGCIVALASRERSAFIADDVLASYRQQTGRQGKTFSLTAVDGASQIGT
jgi:galactokinase